MFDKVDTKFKRAEFFLENIRTLSVGTQPWRACLEAFFFELISAKDFFLQEINDKYGLGLERDEATIISKLKERLSDGDALEVVKSLEKELSNVDSWLWKINNYRNAATHRELLHLGYEASAHLGYEAGTGLVHVEVHLFEDPEDIKKGNMRLEVLPYCEQSLRDMRDFLEGLYSKLG